MSTNQAVVTCDGQGVDPAARIRYRAETVIHASPVDDLEPADRRGTLAGLTAAAGSDR